MANAVKTIGSVRQKMSKADRAAREEAEALVVTVAKTKPKPTASVTKVQKKLFNKIVKLNDNFTESDSMSLSMLTKSFYRYELLNERLEELDELDERAVDIERRILNYEKSIAAHMKDLCIPLSARLRLSNEMAKLLIEEKKLANMEAQNAPAVNPLLALLEDDDYE